MDKYKLFDLLASDASADAADATNVQLLAEVIDDYPYFQTAHLLLSGKLAATGKANDGVLSRAATHLTNRETLYKMLRKVGTTTAPEVARTITAHNNTSPVTENSVNNVSLPAVDEPTPPDDLHALFDDIDLSDKPTEFISKIDLHSVFDDIDLSDRPTEAIRIAQYQPAVEEIDLHDAITQAVPADKQQAALESHSFDNETERNIEVPDTYDNTSDDTSDEETIRIDRNIDLLIPIQPTTVASPVENIENVVEKSNEAISVDTQDITEKHVVTKDADNSINTGQITAKARQQVEKELQQIAAIKQPDDDDINLAEAIELTALLERESRELIQRDVEKDLEELQLIVHFDGDDAFPRKMKEEPLHLEDIDIAESEQLIQSLREKVETYKKEKLIQDEPVNSLSDSDSRAIKMVVAEQISHQTPLDDDDDVVYLGNIVETQAEKSVYNTESILSETMARVYARQGYTEKAVQIYEQLMAKYPEKRAFFAEKIAKLH